MAKPDMVQTLKILSPEPGGAEGPVLDMPVIRSYTYSGHNESFRVRTFAYLWQRVIRRTVDAATYEEMIGRGMLRPRQYPLSRKWQ